ncbi:hypothetical protein K0M31_019431 [Melipona bicolor]|uniref:Uncharacterized protein n=1 Tax=Melipona bicolor TaxID=60889 RepID=A0AA40G293_9HYME|nr:hypothetical protein K0M31_019431 [Melipona bicolor]
MVEERYYAKFPNRDTLTLEDVQLREEIVVSTFATLLPNSLIEDPDDRNELKPTAVSSFISATRFSVISKETERLLRNNRATGVGFRQQQSQQQQQQQNFN